jgi:hypothetical protein
MLDCPTLFATRSSPTDPPPRPGAEGLVTLRTLRPFFSILLQTSLQFNLRSPLSNPPQLICVVYVAIPTDSTRDLRCLIFHLFVPFPAP